MPETHLPAGTTTFVQSADKTVTYWPAADKDGDGDLVWVNQTDVNGNSVGRQIAKDKDGNQLRNYRAPEGFTNYPSFDHTDNYVRTGYNGEVYRTATGEAIGIKPGEAIVEYADGRIEVLKDEFARYVFANSHKPVGVESKPVPDDKPAAKTGGK